METGGKRRSGSRCPPRPPDVEKAKPRGALDYDRYLAVLQERNRLLRKLRQKDSHQIELEKREQGFSLYLNGANNLRQIRISKTEEDETRLASKTADAEKPAEGESDQTLRAKTAPLRRKGWSHESFDLKTEQGEALHVGAPGPLSSRYNDIKTDEGTEAAVLKFGDIPLLRKSLEEDEIVQLVLSGNLDPKPSDPTTTIERCGAEELTEQEATEGAIILEFPPHHPVTTANRSLDSPTPVTPPLSVDTPTSVTTPTSVITPGSVATPTSTASPISVHSLAVIATDPSDTLTTIIKKVRDMSASQQRRLLQLLSELDSSLLSDKSMVHDVDDDGDGGDGSGGVGEDGDGNRDDGDSDKGSGDVLSDKDDDGECDGGDGEGGSGGLGKEGSSTSKDGGPPSTKALCVSLTRGGLGTPASLLENSNEPMTSSDEVYNHRVIELRILSNWGDRSVVGLTEVEFYSAVDGKQMRLASSGVHVDDSQRREGRGGGKPGDAAKLVNGTFKTADVKHMWTHPYSQGDTITLTFTLPLHLPLARIKVWNYNGAICDIGARLVEVVVCGEMVWKGELIKGRGDPNSNYCTEISMLPQNVVPDWLQELKPPAQEGKPPTPLLQGGKPSTPLVQGRKPPTPLVQEGKPPTPLVQEGKPPTPLVQGGKPPTPLVQERKPSLFAKGNNQTLFGDSQILEKPSSRPSSGRTSGLRGQLLSQQGNSLLSQQGHSYSEGDLLSCPEQCHPRLQTAVIRGRCHSISDGHDVSSLPTISPLSSLLVADKSVPTMSGQEPIVSVGRSREQASDIEHLLASISHFDHTHHGQVGTDCADTTVGVLDSMSGYQLTRQSVSRSQGFPSEACSVSEAGDGDRGTVFCTPEAGDGDRGTVFCTPELPMGQHLQLNILSTWGDRYYVGLTGVEVFTETGEKATVKEISADPADINVLPEYKNDPRVVSNLVDGVNKTRDDLHMWLAPFTAGRDHLILVTFQLPVTIAVVRIWNYNKSRIHSFRGAKLLEMHLDNQLIFRGEIARASGGLVGGAEAFGETILFTTDEEVLMRVALHDDVFFEEVGVVNRDLEPVSRPTTADKTEVTEVRPTTQATLSPSPVVDAPIGQVIHLQILATWGSHGNVGLTGLELVQIDNSTVRASISSSVEEDEDVLRLVDGVVLTIDPSHMWLVPLAEGGCTLTLTVDQRTHLKAIRLWNYNASLEDSYKGVRLMHVYVDGRRLSPEEGYIVRRAPGHTHYQYGQLLQFYTQPRSGAAKRTSTSPTGFVYQFQLLSTWGDPYYVGLNGLQLYDVEGQQISLTVDNIAAFPESVNILEGVRGDVRTPDKLVDGVYDTDDGKHMWLAPVLPDMVNSVYVIFDEPVTVSSVKLWNYAKTTSRGVKEFAILVDDLLIHLGMMAAIPSYARGILPTLHPPHSPHIVTLDRGDPLVGESENLPIGHSLRKPSANQALRPLTSLRRGRMD